MPHRYEFGPTKAYVFVLLAVCRVLWRQAGFQQECRCHPAKENTLGGGHPQCTHTTKYNLSTKRKRKPWPDHVLRKRCVPSNNPEEDWSQDAHSGQQSSTVVNTCEDKQQSYKASYQRSSNCSGPAVCLM